jgi:hypothetical protein
MYVQMEDIGELDLAQTIAGSRVRMNLFRQQGSVSASLRILSDHIPEISQLGLPPLVSQFPTWQKGIILVSSGIEFEKYEQARSEILAQLEACRRGEITAGELLGARRIVVNGLRTTLDSQGRMADYWLGQAVAGLKEGPESLAEKVERVTAEQLALVAQKLELDTIYFLKGKEGA